MHAPRKLTLKERFEKSPYFIGAILLHLLIFLLIGGMIIFEAMLPKQEFDSSFLLGGGDPGPAAPPAASEATPDAASTEVAVQTPQAASSSLSELITVNTTDPTAFSVPISTMSTPDPNAMAKVTETVTANMAKASASAFAGRSAGIKGTVGKWGTGGGGSGGAGPTGSGKSTQAEFVCYVGKVAGLDSNRLLMMTYSNSKLKDEPGGPIHNLTRMINEWSHGRIKAKLQPEALDLASQKLHETAPPFVYFSGSKEFSLTNAEVENLRKYLVNGGAIWGDSGLAGVGSRFDVAFRREMKRVIPDADKQFEILPKDHPVYQGDKAFFQLNKGAPPGMNYRHDPVEVIKMDGEIAVIYTPNNYTDMMRVAFKMPIRENKNVADTPGGAGYFTKMQLWRLQDTFCRNFGADGAEDAFQLGINIVVHLLTRFQERLMFSS